MELKQRERLLAILAVACLVAWTADQLVFTPLWNTWKARDARITTLTTSLVRGHSLVDRKQELESRWKDMQKRGLPDKQAAAEAETLKAITRWSNASGLAVNSQKPRWIVADEDTPPKIEVRLGAQGNLEEIARFMYEVESDPLAFRIEDFNINSRDTRGQRLTLDLRLTGLGLQGASPS